MWNPLAQLPPEGFHALAYTNPVAAQQPVQTGQPGQNPHGGMGNPWLGQRRNIADWWGQRPQGVSLPQGFQPQNLPLLLRGMTPQRMGGALSRFFPNPTPEVQTWLNARPSFPEPQGALEPWRGGQW